jgi:hypothetical protein
MSLAQYFTSLCDFTDDYINTRENSVRDLRRDERQRLLDGDKKTFCLRQILLV